jgi:hypothetical protein
VDETEDGAEYRGYKFWAASHQVSESRHMCCADMPRDFVRGPECEAVELVLNYAGWTVACVVLDRYMSLGVVVEVPVQEWQRPVVERGHGAGSQQRSSGDVLEYYDPNLGR